MPAARQGCLAPYGLSCAPKTLCRSPSPQHLECDCVWRHSLYRGDKGKLRSLGWDLTQPDRCPSEKRLDTHAQRDSCVRTQEKTASASQREAAEDTSPVTPSSSTPASRTGSQRTSAVEAPACVPGLRCLTVA